MISNKMIEDNKSEIENYWNRFYSSSNIQASRIPSQFASFAASEFSNTSKLIELGCGNGRDSEFFGHLGFKVLAIDGAEAAIDYCQNQSQNHQVTYRLLKINQIGDLLSELAGSLEPFFIYGRFFLHAITLEEQNNMFEAFARKLPSGTTLAFEYRSMGDINDDKYFGDHYRRFIDHKTLIADLRNSCFEVIYEIEGKGYARYKSEDAFVGRLLLRRV